MKRPEFKGNPRNEADLDAYVEALQAWEEAEEFRQRAELSKAEVPSSPLAGLFDDMLEGDPRFIEGPTGPGGPPGPTGPSGAGTPPLYYAVEASTPQAVSAASAVVDMDTESLDSDDAFTGNTLTIRSAGTLVLNFTCAVTLTSGSSQDLTISLRKNGSPIAQTSFKV